MKRYFIFTLFFFFLFSISLFGLDTGYIWMNKNDWVMFTVTSSCSTKLWAGQNSNVTFEIKYGLGNNLTNTTNVNVNKNNYITWNLTGNYTYKFTIKSGDIGCVYIPNYTVNVIWKRIILSQGNILRTWRLPDNAWKEFANKLVDNRISVRDSIFNTFYNIASINPSNVALQQGLGSLLNGIGNSYFPESSYQFFSDSLVDFSNSYAQLLYDIQYKVTRSATSAFGSALSEVYGAAFMGLQYAQWMRNILWEVVPQSIMSAQTAYDRTVAFQSFANSIRSAAWSNLDNLKNYLIAEKNARNENNKIALKNALESQLGVLYGMTDDTNTIYTHDESMSNGTGLSLWHIYAKAYRIAKSRENNPNYPTAERQAYTMIKILSKKLMATMLNLYIQTSWIKRLEEETYLLKP
jgi:hypothetical protein